MDAIDKLSWDQAWRKLCLAYRQACNQAQADEIYEHVAKFDRRDVLSCLAGWPSNPENRWLPNARDLLRTLNAKREEKNSSKLWKPEEPDESKRFVSPWKLDLIKKYAAGGLSLDQVAAEFNSRKEPHEKPIVIPRKASRA